MEMHHRNRKKNQPHNVEQKKVDHDISSSPPSMAFPSVPPPASYITPNKEGVVCIYCQKGFCFRVSFKPPPSILSSPPPPSSQPLAGLPSPPTLPLPQKTSSIPPLILILNHEESHKKLQKQNLLLPGETNPDKGAQLPVKSSSAGAMLRKIRSESSPPLPPLLPPIPLSPPSLPISTPPSMPSSSSPPMWGLRNRNEGARKLELQSVNGSYSEAESSLMAGALYENCPAISHVIGKTEQK
ncbi:hypothetical protein LXL04_028888 [Taraxacum kok-saghyz]